MKTSFLLMAPVILALISAISLTRIATAQAQPESWTGGFWLEGNWVAVNVRFDRQNENPSGIADIIFPFYRGSENAINVALDGLKQTADNLHFEIPVGARTGKGWEQIEAIMEKGSGERWLAYTNSPGALERLRQVYETIMIYDPVPALENLHIPVLAIWGSRDTYLPVPETVAIFKQAMAKAGNKNYVIKIYRKLRSQFA